MPTKKETKIKQKQSQKQVVNININEKPKKKRGKKKTQNKANETQVPYMGIPSMERRKQIYKASNVDKYIPLPPPIPENELVKEMRQILLQTNERSIEMANNNTQMMRDYINNANNLNQQILNRPQNNRPPVVVNNTPAPITLNPPNITITNPIPNYIPPMNLRPSEGIINNVNISHKGPDIPSGVEIEEERKTRGRPKLKIGAVDPFQFNNQRNTYDILQADIVREAGNNIGIKAHKNLDNIMKDPDKKKSIKILKDAIRRMENNTQGVLSISYDSRLNDFKQALQVLMNS